MGEVKRTFNPEFINRIDEIIVFDALTDEDLVQDHAAARRAAQPEPEGEGDHRHASATMRSSGCSPAPCPTAPTARARCAGPSSATSRTPSPRPSSAARIRAGRPIEIGVEEGTL